MLSIFRTNQILNSVLLIFYILILRSSVFVVPPEWELGSMGVLSAIFFEWIEPASLWAYVISFGLLLFQAIIINTISVKHRLSNEINLFPGLFYLLISSLLPDFLYLSPLLIANTFFLIVISELLETYKVPACADRIFNVGFWIGIASLFYFSYIIFILLGLIGLGILRAFYLRERIGLIVGGLVPYILLGTYYFWFDQFDFFYDTQITQNISWLDFQVGKIGSGTLIKIIAFSLILIAVLLSSRFYKLKKIIQVQKKIDILLVALLVGGISILFQSKITTEHFLILSIPIGILLSFNFTNMKKQWAESIHLIILIVVLAWQYRSLLI